MPNRKHYFTIDRRPGAAFFPSLPIVGAKPYELTIVGVTGQTHTYRTGQIGEDDHFTDEGRYRHAIEDAVEKNGG